MPDELQQEIRPAAQQTGLSMADIMRQSMKAGLPKVVERGLFRPSSTSTHNYLQVCGRLPSTCKYVQAEAILGWDHGLSADRSQLLEALIGIAVAATFAWLLIKQASNVKTGQ